VLDLLHGQVPAPDQQERAGAIRRAIDFVTTLATKPEEEEKRWWK
jgi:hypothetical protein